MSRDCTKCVDLGDIRLTRKSKKIRHTRWYIVYIKTWAGSTAGPMVATATVYNDRSAVKTAQIHVYFIICHTQYLN